MPIYQYQCKSCTHPFDSYLTSEKRDQPLKSPCKLCGGEVRRVFTPQYNAAIPGQYNRINRHWRETGRPIEQEYADLMLPSEE